MSFSMVRCNVNISLSSHTRSLIMGIDIVCLVDM